MGDEALGVVTGGWYAARASSRRRTRASSPAVDKEYGADPGYYTLGAYSAGALVEAAGEGGERQGGRQGRASRKRFSAEPGCRRDPRGDWGGWTSMATR